MRIALALIVLAACGSSGDDYPVGPGGSMGPILPGNGFDARVDGGGDGGAGDGALGDGDVGSMMTGRVCLVTDLRVLDDCAMTGAGGLTVTLGEATATTSDNGVFGIATQTATGLVWRVHGSSGTAQITPSVMSLTAVHVIPAIDATAYGNLVMGQTGRSFVPGNGSIVARVVDGSGDPMQGVTATDSPAPSFSVLYDGSTATSWTQLGTASHGVVWIPFATNGANLLDVSPPTGSDVHLTAPVEDVSITFVTVAL